MILKSADVNLIFNILKNNKNEVHLTSVLEALKNDYLANSKLTFEVLKSNTIRIIKDTAKIDNIVLIDDNDSDFWKKLEEQEEREEGEDNDNNDNNNNSPPPPSSSLPHESSCSDFSDAEIKTTSSKRSINYLCGNGTKSCAVDLSGCWIIGGVNITKNLMKYLKKVIKALENDKKKIILNDTQIMALFFIFYYNGPTQSRYRLPRQVMPLVSQSIYHDTVEIDDHLVTWCQYIKRKLIKLDYDATDLKLAEYKIMAVKNNNNNERKMVFLLESFRIKHESWQEKPLTENTYLFQNCSMFLDIMISSDKRLYYQLTHGHLSSGLNTANQVTSDEDSNSNNEISSTATTTSPESSSSAARKTDPNSSSATAPTTKKRKLNDGSATTSTPIEKIMPDYLATYRLDDHRSFDLFSVEVKKDKAKITQLYSDKAKLSIELKDMMDALVTARVCDPVVCGMVTDGYDCTNYKMVLEDEANYRFIKIGFFHMLRGVEDLTLMPGISEGFMQLKQIIDATIEKIDERFYPQLPASPTPRTAIPNSYQRPSWEIPK